MLFEIYGPFDLSTSTTRTLVLSANARREFWAAVEDRVPGLPEACGCYVFVLAARNREMPWYVGKAERTSFRKECLTPHKLLHFTAATLANRGVPRLYLAAQITPKGKLRACTVGSRPAITELESILIGMGVARNPDLLNMRGTRMLRKLQVQGFMNTSLAKRGPAKRLRSVFE